MTMPVYGINAPLMRSASSGGSVPTWRKHSMEEMRQKREFDGYSAFEESPRGRRCLEQLKAGRISQEQFDEEKKNWETGASWRLHDKETGNDPETKMNDEWFKSHGENSAWMAHNVGKNALMNDLDAKGDAELDRMDAERAREREIDRERRNSNLEDWMRGHDIDFEDGQA